MFFCIFMLLLIQTTVQVTPKEYLAELEKIGINAKAKNFLVFQVDLMHPAWLFWISKSLTSGCCGIDCDEESEGENRSL